MIIFRFLLKLFYFPIFVFLYRIKIYHKDKFSKTRIRNTNFIIINDNKNVRLTLSFKYYFHKLVFIKEEVTNKFADKLFKSFYYKDKNIKEIISKYLKKNYKIVFIVNNDGKIKDIDNDLIDVINSFENKKLLPIYLINSKLSFKRLRINIGETLALPKDKLDIKKELNFLNKQIGLYLKYHTYDFFDFSWWFYDLCKIFSIIIIPKIYIVFPIKVLYSKEMNKEDKKIKGKGLLMSNHNTFLDPFLTTFILPNRRIRYIAALDAMNSSKFLKRTHKYYHSIILDRSKPQTDLNMFNETLDVLNANGLVGIFPEGHVVKEGNKLARFNSGVTLIALTSKATIYPFVFLKRYQAFKKQYIIFGKPINLEDYIKEGTRVDENLIKSLTTMLEEKMNNLQKEGYEMIKRRNK